VTTPAPTSAAPVVDFPLFKHGNGQWAKKIKGKLRYFGTQASEALAAYNRLGDNMHKPSRQSTTKLTSSNKPAKPHKDFPLFAHDSGQWAKKVRGRTHYFGPWADSKAALDRWLEAKDDLLGGKVRRRGDALTLRELANDFLRAKKASVESGELDERSWQEYHNICERVLEVLGKHVAVVDLRPSDFGRLRASFSKNAGPVTLTGYITRSHVLFNYAYKNDLVDRPVKYGDQFSKPKRNVLRKERVKRGKRLFSAEQICKLLKLAKGQLRAMMLLGINCGFGNNDCAKLSKSHLDLEGGWIDYPRPKTGVDRRCPLWKETVRALNTVADSRPDPKDPLNSDLVVVTKYGFAWLPKSKTWADSPITKEFAKLLQNAGMKRQGLSFYALRHTFQTIAEQSLDKDAVRCIMGHAEGANDMSAVYSEERPRAL
jgi:integrase